jgi:acetyltransferase-like isoleucine patch superfamily enzyme
MTNKFSNVSLNKLEKFYLFVLGIPKTILFNFWYFPFKDAIRLPVYVSHRVWLMRMAGSVDLAVVRSGVVRIGFGDVGIFDRQRQRSIWQVSGQVTFNGEAKIGHGSKISVTGNLVLGDNFCVSAESALVAHDKITIGDNVLVSWDVLVMDSDHHHILNESGECINPSKAVLIGNNVWVGCRSVILKGVSIADGVVVSAGTTLTKSILTNNVIVGGGGGVRILKQNISWKQ